jgi:hypothetical protein
MKDMPNGMPGPLEIVGFAGVAMMSSGCHPKGTMKDINKLPDIIS